jgi:hypothetical protein
LIEEYQLRVVNQKVILKGELYEVNSKLEKHSENSPSVEKSVKHSPSAAVMGQCQCAECNPIEEEVSW